MPGSSANAVGPLEITVPLGDDQKIWKMLLVLVNAVALPLTQSFVGEWLMFAGLWQVDGWLAALAVVTIVLGAIYMFYAFQRAMLGPDKWKLEMHDATLRDHLYLVPLIAITLVLGVHPAPVLDLVDAPVQLLLSALP